MKSLPVREPLRRGKFNNPSTTALDLVKSPENHSLRPQNLTANPIKNVKITLKKSLSVKIHTGSNRSGRTPLSAGADTFVTVTAGELRTEPVYDIIMPFFPTPACFQTHQQVAIDSHLLENRHPSPAVVFLQMKNLSRICRVYVVTLELIELLMAYVPDQFLTISMYDKLPFGFSRPVDSIWMIWSVV